MRNYILMFVLLATIVNVYNVYGSTNIIWNMNDPSDNAKWKNEEADNSFVKMRGFGSHMSKDYNITSEKIDFLAQSYVALELVFNIRFAEGFVWFNYKNDEKWSKQRRIAFNCGYSNKVVLHLSLHPGWDGTIHQLKISVLHRSKQKKVLSGIKLLGLRNKTVDSDKQFVLLITMLKKYQNTKGWEKILSSYNPHGGGPYAGIGFVRDIGYVSGMAPKRNNYNFLTNKNDPELIAISRFWKLAKKFNVPIEFGVVGGPWFEQKHLAEPNANDALEEHRKNCMWNQYNQVNKSTPNNIDPMPFKLHYEKRNNAGLGDIFLTLSRLAMDVRRRFKRNRHAAFLLIKSMYDERPDLINSIRLEGELEMNRLAGICDYNPFAIREFVMWIKGEGIYRKGNPDGYEAYVNASRYRGKSVKVFNRDFGTSFKTWKLKYFNQAEFAAAVEDRVNAFNLDIDNPGGFDPPRKLEDHSFPKKNSSAKNFDQLWNYFRGVMIYNEYRDAAREAVALGLPSRLLYTAAIPGVSPKERKFQGGITNWQGVNEYSRFGISLYNDHRKTISRYLNSISVVDWGVQEWRLGMDPPAERVRSYLREYWKQGAHFVNMLVYPTHIGSYGYKKGVSKFIDEIKRKKLRPRTVQ